MKLVSAVCAASLATACLPSAASFTIVNHAGTP